MRKRACVCLTTRRKKNKAFSVDRELSLLKPKYFPVGQKRTRVIIFWRSFFRDWKRSHFSYHKDTPATTDSMNKNYYVTFLRHYKPLIISVNLANLCFFSPLTLPSSRDILALRTTSFLRNVFVNCFLAECSSCLAPRMFVKEPIKVENTTA